MAKYLLHIVGDIEPHIVGPYPTERARDAAARKLKAKVGDEDGIFMLDAEDPKVDCYSGGFFEANGGGA